MAKYVIEFSKYGFVRYTSHLDLLRLFKRAFKRCGILLEYSQGFNPHPKLGFAQPLPLGFTAKHELLEFSTENENDTDVILKAVRDTMPIGIDIISCKDITGQQGTLAAKVKAAEYTAVFPEIFPYGDSLRSLVSEFYEREEIIGYKRQKKTKKYVPVDIKPMIKSISVSESRHNTVLMTLDCGSSSNLNPEIVVSALIEFSGADIDKTDVDISRDLLIFDN